MEPVPVIAVFDVGKTNKKLFLFDRSYRIVYEQSIQLQDTVDEDGCPCEDISQLRKWILESFRALFQKPAFKVVAVNFSAYGASFVHLDDTGSCVTPLYNYLKEYPAELKTAFYKEYGPEKEFVLTTASPSLGHLNSGLQLYWLKHSSGSGSRKIQHSLHLPQYLSYLLTGRMFSDLSSLGCHTALWDFNQQQYHSWVGKEGLLEQLAPIVPADTTGLTQAEFAGIPAGVGLHDSSAALIPYLLTFKEPFVLISTGTWCISLNPFNNSALTPEELQQDCLCYLAFDGRPIKASRLFAEQEHEDAVKQLAETYSAPADFYKDIPSDPKAPSAISAAYHQFMNGLVAKQVASTRLVLDGTAVKIIYVDGGFSKNQVYMQLLATALPDMEIYAASVAQASALGAALAIHQSWNPSAVPSELIEVRRY